MLETNPNLAVARSPEAARQKNHLRTCWRCLQPYLSRYKSARAHACPECRKRAWKADQKCAGRPFTALEKRMLEVERIAQMGGPQIPPSTLAVAYQASLRFT